jgi:hypothetical protein
MVRELLLPSLPSRDSRLSCRDPLAVTPAERRQALCRALALCLWRAGGTTHAKVVVPADTRMFSTTLAAIAERTKASPLVPSTLFHAAAQDECMPRPGGAAAAAAATAATAAAAAAVTISTPPTKSATVVQGTAAWTEAPADELFFTSSLTVHTFTAIDAMVACIDKHFDLFCSKGGLILILHSLLLSRGAHALRTDFAADITSLICEDSCSEQVHTHARVCVCVCVCVCVWECVCVCRVAAFFFGPF